MCGPILLGGEGDSQERQAPRLRSAQGAACGKAELRGSSRSSSSGRRRGQLGSPAPRMERVPSNRSKQRKLVRLFPQGASVEIFSASLHEWFLDGEVVEVAWESGIRDHVPVSAGSTKIVYGQGRHFEWVGSHRLHDTVRESIWPEQMVGQVMLETRLWFVGFCRWSHFKLSKGILQWWDTEEDVHAGQKPVGAIKLSGMQLDRDGLSVKVQTNDTQGIVYSFKAQQEEVVDRFVDVLWAHSAACGEERK